MTVFRRAKHPKEKSEARTIVNCKQACLAKDGCVGFDFDRKKTECWLSNQTTITPQVVTIPMSNYKLMDTCKMATTGMYYCSLCSGVVIDCYACE